MKDIQNDIITELKNIIEQGKSQLASSVDDNLIYGDLSIPLDIIVKDFEFNVPPEMIWEYTDECLSGSKINYIDFLKGRKIIM